MLSLCHFATTPGGRECCHLAADTSLPVEFHPCLPGLAMSGRPHYPAMNRWAIFMSPFGAGREQTRFPGQCAGLGELLPRWSKTITRSRKASFQPPSVGRRRSGQRAIPHDGPLIALRRWLEYSTLPASAATCRPQCPSHRGTTRWRGWRVRGRRAER